MGNESTRKGANGNINIVSKSPYNDTHSLSMPSQINFGNKINMRVPFQNNTKDEILLCTTFCDKDFIIDDDEKYTNTYRQQNCPEIIIKLGKIETTALLDSGANLSGISEKFFNEHKNDLPNLSIFPLSNLNIRSAFGQKSKQLKRIIFTEITIKDLTFVVQLILIPGLIRTIVLGTDVLHQMRACLDFDRNIFILYNDNLNSKCENFIYNNDDIKETMMSNSINHNSRDFSCQCRPKHFEILKFSMINMKGTDCLIIEKPLEKHNKEMVNDPEIYNADKICTLVEKIDSISCNQKKKLENLLMKFRPIFPR